MVQKILIQVIKIEVVGSKLVRFLMPSVVFHFREGCGVYPKKVSCRTFEHFALQTDPVTEFIKLGSALFKEGATLAPKLA